MKLENFSGHGSGTKSFNKIVNQANKAIAINNLLFDAFIVLDCGTQEERLIILDRLKKHFEECPPCTQGGAA
ncbi:hypothetical protein O1C99_001856 [Vibrio cholerae]|nr:hypothetical protein [Vibrio cholerae]